MDFEIEDGQCPNCGTKAELRTCDQCGTSAWIIDCGHYAQPRPIAAGRSDGSEMHHTFCEDCAEGTVVTAEPTSIDVREWSKSTAITLEWETGEGDERLRGWSGADGLRAIETNGATVWSEATDLDLPFDSYWDARSLNAVHCDCGRWSGVRCAWSGSVENTVIIEWMPQHLRASHEAAGNRGAASRNGAERIRVNRECAEWMIDTDGEWCSIIEE